MAIRSRATQERRNTSRIIVRMDCEFTYEGVTHKAVIVDLSLRGALLSSVFLPPDNAKITVKLSSPKRPKVVTFEGKVIRGTWANTDHGKRGRFGIHFHHAPSDLIAFMKTPPD